MIMETILSHVADTLGLERRRVQEVNLLASGDPLACGNVIDDCTVQRCWSSLMTECGYEGKRSAVESFNRFIKCLYSW